MNKEYKWKFYVFYNFFKLGYDITEFVVTLIVTVCIEKGCSVPDVAQYKIKYLSRSYY